LKQQQQSQNTFNLFLTDEWWSSLHIWSYTVSVVWKGNWKKIWRKIRYSYN
jgi:hypothetical protein